MKSAGTLFAVACLGLVVVLCGCNEDERLNRSLLERNAQLQNQITSQFHLSTALAATLILTACGLAAALWWRSGKGGPD